MKALEWISMEERTPNAEGSYIVCTKTNSVTSAHWYGSKRGWAPRKLCITHWMCFPHGAKEVKHRKESLCWECYRSTHFKEFPCPWAHKFIPVDGWNATPTVRNGGGDSFLVKECPIYMKDRRRK